MGMRQLVVAAVSRTPTRETLHVVEGIGIVAHPRSSHRQATRRHRAPSTRRGHLARRKPDHLMTHVAMWEDDATWGLMVTDEEYLAATHA